MPAGKIKLAEEEITRKCFDEVVPRFQTIREGSSFVTKKIFYDYDESKGKIYVKPEALLFFKQNYPFLFKAVIFEWAKFLEKINTVPKLISKIESDEVRRHSLQKYKTILEKSFKNCFYCNVELKTTKVHVDHFIPWSYIFEDEIWNFVLSCSDCNLKKLDSLATTSFQEKIITRNKDYAEKIDGLKKSLNLLDSGNGWANALGDHYENCGDFGFTVVELP